MEIYLIRIPKIDSKQILHDARHLHMCKLCDDNMAKIGFTVNRYFLRIWIVSILQI